MSRIAVGTACVATFLVSSFELMRRWRTLGIFALERAERIFDTLENVHRRLRAIGELKDSEATNRLLKAGPQR